MRLLDLFCGAGGASKGYADAGFEVVGVDIDAQKYYPYEFHQADAMTYPLEGFDVIHASPPCQHYANVTRWRGNQDDHPDLLGLTLERLATNGAPYVIENVPGAPMEPDLILCGSMFGLKVRRHRWFLTDPALSMQGLVCNHQKDDLPFMHKGERAYADAMGCDWMSAMRGRQAIPPAYTEFIGRQLMEKLA